MNKIEKFQIICRWKL